jgi:hypothetical protein
MSGPLLTLLGAAALVVAGILVAVVTWIDAADVVTLSV